MRAVKGVNSEGFMTMVFPVARAGPIFQHNINTANISVSDDVLSCGEESRKERTREIPGDNLAHDTEWLMDGVDELIFVGLDGLTVDLVGPASIVSDGEMEKGTSAFFAHSKVLPVERTGKFRGCQRRA
jgi:hypothetical protein